MTSLTVWSPSEDQENFAKYVLENNLNPDSVTTIGDAAKHLNLDIRTVKGWWHESGFKPWLMQNKADYHLGQAEMLNSMLCDKAVQNGNTNDLSKAIAAACKLISITTARVKEYKKEEKEEKTTAEQSQDMINDLRSHKDKFKVVK